MRSVWSLILISSTMAVLSAGECGSGVDCVLPTPVSGITEVVIDKDHVYSYKWQWFEYKKKFVAGTLSSGYYPNKNNELCAEKRKYVQSVGYTSFDPKVFGGDAAVGEVCPTPPPPGG